MALFFNLDNLEKEADGDPYKILKILDIFYHKKLPNPRKQIPRIKNNLKGTSFILNPEPLFSIKNTDPGYKVQYIRLAARRDFGAYKHYGVKSLPLSYFPDINMPAILSNPLLKITDTDIYFMYEELLKERKNGNRL